MIWIALLACSDPCRDSGTVCTLAGDGEAGFHGDEEDARGARLYYPTDVVARPGTDTWVVVDWNNERIRMTDSEGVIRTVVGADIPGDGDPTGGERIEPGARGTSVRLNHPIQAEFAPDGQLYIAAWHNHKIRRWDPDLDRVRVTVGNFDATTGNNGGFDGDGGPAEAAHVWFPSSIAFQADGSYVFTDERNLRVRQVGVDGVMGTIAGCGEPGATDGEALLATFHFPDDPTTPQPKPGGALEVDGDGMIWIADTYSGRLRRLDPTTGMVDTLAVAGMVQPADVELGPDGRLYVADNGAHVIFAIDPVDGAAEIVAGTGEPGDGEDGVAATESALDTPYGLDFADDGALLIADTYNSKIRRVTP